MWFASELLSVTLILVFAVCAVQAVRRSWAQRAYANDVTLNLAVEACRVDQDALMAAENAYASVQAATLFPFVNVLG